MNKYEFLIFGPFFCQNIKNVRGHLKMITETCNIYFPPVLCMQVAPDLEPSVHQCTALRDNTVEATFTQWATQSLIYMSDLIFAWLSKHWNAIWLFMVHLEFWRTTSNSSWFRSALQCLLFIFSQWLFGGDEAEPAGWKISSQSHCSKEIRRSEDETPANKFFYVHRGSSVKAACIPRIISSWYGYYSSKSELKKKENGHDWPRRPWCPRGASQHVVIPNLSSCQTKVQTFITVSWPWLSLPRGFYIKDKSKTPHFISSLPHASSVSRLNNFFFYKSTPPHHPAALWPITFTCEQQRCLNEQQTKGKLSCCQKSESE